MATYMLNISSPSHSMLSSNLHTKVNQRMTDVQTEFVNLKARITS